MREWPFSTASDRIAETNGRVTDRIDTAREQTESADRTVSTAVFWRPR